MRAAAPQQHDVGSRDAIVALGVLSAAGSTAKSNATTGVRRREKLREALAPFAKSTATALRFLVADGRLRLGDAVYEEARRWRDILFLEMHEDPRRCSLKYLLWLRQAPALFPAAAWFALADDDIYLQVAHLEADLRLVASQTRDAAEHVLYGLLMWKPYYNNATLNPSTGFASWDYHDWAAVAIRRTMRKCAAALRRSDVSMLPDGRPVRAHAPACYALRADHMRAVMGGHVDAMPPFPYINGPLFAVSRSLGGLIASSPLPAAFLAGLERQPKTAKWGISCTPVVDSILGYWVAATALAANASVTLVNSPRGKQHLPWPSWGFGNHSIVVHGLRSSRQDAFRSNAVRNGGGDFVPTPRTCDSCRAMGWTTWPGTPLHDWRCCGVRHPGGGRRVAACVGRRCPRVDKEHKKLLVQLAKEDK